jgi:predicted lipoprotein
MNSDPEKFKRAVAAQGFAALAFFFFAHGAHGATLPSHALAHPAATCHAAMLRQLRRP